MQHYITTTADKHRNKIQKHLSRYINVHSPVWVLPTGMLQVLQFDKFRHKITSYQITALFAHNHSKPQILKQIGGGNFQYLLVLHLSNNSLKNIEALLFFDAPFLEALYLDRNLLVSLRTLRKFITKSIKILDLSYNHIKNIDFLFQFDSPNLKQLFLTSNEGVGSIQSLMKCRMSPQYLYLNNMNFVGPVAKNMYIDTCWRELSEETPPKTKL